MKEEDIMSKIELLNNNGEKGEYMAFYEIICPSTGNTYLLDTLPTFTTVEQCAKFHRPAFIPEHLKYNFTQFNN